jgi:hypothetical protein
MDKLLLMAKVLAIGSKADKFLESQLGQTNKFLAKRDELFDAWWVELVTQLDALSQRISEVEAGQASRRLTDDLEAQGILANYADEAYGEPIAERRRMLAFAAAGIANMSIGIAEHARVQRILRELEADDVIALYGLWLIPTRVPGRQPDQVKNEPGLTADQLRFRNWEQCGAESLQSSGCVRVVAAGGGAGRGTFEELRVTTTGTTILRALRAYVRARSPNLQNVPGHEVTDRFRSEAEARRIVDAVPGLYDAVLSARGKGFDATARFSGLNIAQGAAADGKTKLYINLHPEQVSKLRQVTTQEKVEHGQPVQGIFLDHVGTVGDDGRVRVQVAGPHDVMRFLAYDIDATWD